MSPNILEKFKSRIARAIRENEESFDFFGSVAISQAQIKVDKKVAHVKADGENCFLIRSKEFGAFLYNKKGFITNPPAGTYNYGFKWYQF